MLPISEPPYSASSPPFILDSDMPGGLDPENPEFFDTNPLDSAYNSNFYLVEDVVTEGSHFPGRGFESPIASKSSPFAECSNLHQTLSAPSTASPSGSDSSSNSSGYKRKSSSDSSRSEHTTADVMMSDEMDMGDWKAADLRNGHMNFSGYDAPRTINPANMESHFNFSDKNMENDFDFESASSSPNIFGAGPLDMSSPEMPTIKHDRAGKKSPINRTKSMAHNKAISQHSVTQSVNGLSTGRSREASPLSAVIISQESSPSAFYNKSPSPGTLDHVNGTSGTMLKKEQSQLNTGWNTNFDHRQHNGMNAVQMPQHGLPHIGMQPNQSMQPNHYSQQHPPPHVPQNMPSYKPSLLIHPTPLKSRVETQIPIKLTLFPVPAGITKLHLPTYTISKPKLLAKPGEVGRSPDTLELYTSLVCTSAMQNPEYKRRAFERAAKGDSAVVDSPPSEDGDEDDENKPSNGGDVKICSGCITRERKRAARKKVKKIEEEESWHKDEAKRVVVFNTQELKDWQMPSSQPPSDAIGDRQDPFIPHGALQVDAPMRIACYCRHQNEKLGFQVIFTLKDFQDRLVAQGMTSSIMITDDHKTHNMPSLTTQNSNGSDVPVFPVPTTGPCSFSSEGPFDPSNAPANNRACFRLSTSSSDLQSMQNAVFDSATNGYMSAQPSQPTSATMTPRNLSRQTSPCASTGPLSKKRKASGSGKVPTGLAMTKLETGGSYAPTASATPMSGATSSVPSPFTPNLASFPQSIENPFQPFTAASGIPQPFTAGPPTPNSNDQFFLNRAQSVEHLPLHQMYSAPASSHPSRAPSPNGIRNNAQAYAQQQQMAQAYNLANGMFSAVPMGLNVQRPPTINKLIPGEGPKNGGIEVTCLGSGFCQGLEVMFGDVKATTTTFWGETSLVCLLPPSAVAGSVPVTFHHQHQQQQMQGYPAPPPKNQPYFKYVDDDEQQIIRTALSVLGHKMTGKLEDVTQLARRIVGDGSSWGAPAVHSPNGGSTGASFSVAALGLGDGVEKTLLRILDLIDLDDSDNKARFNLRRESGQTMLHLACSLGFVHFAAALLVRGATADPRDKGGFTPMHFAALHNHTTLVKRLVKEGADPTQRSLRGYTPSDMARSEEVLHATRLVEHHSRTRSGSSMRSKTSSATSLRSLWEPPPSPKEIESSNEDGEDVSETDDEYADEDADADGANDGFWMASRRPSAQITRKLSVDEKDSELALPSDHRVVGGLGSPTAAMTAFRENLSAHIQHIQQSMQLNFPNLPQMNLPQMNLPQMNLPQMPHFGMMPTLPDYQAYFPTTPMARRISNLVGNNTRGEGTTQHQDYKWWEFFSAGNAVAAPPAYEDIFPHDGETKRASATSAATDAVADNKCAELFDQPQVSTQAESSSVAECSRTATKKRPVTLDAVRIGQSHTITREQQDQLRLAHAEKMKRVRSDRNLFFIWIPLLVVVILAMLYNRVPQVYTAVSELVNSIQTRRETARFVEIYR